MHLTSACCGFSRRLARFYTRVPGSIIAGSTTDPMSPRISTTKTQHGWILVEWPLWWRQEKGSRMKYRFLGSLSRVRKLRLMVRWPCLIPKTQRSCTTAWWYSSEKQEMFCINVCTMTTVRCRCGPIFGSTPQRHPFKCTGHYGMYCLFPWCLHVHRTALDLRERALCRVCSSHVRRKRFNMCRYDTHHHVYATVLWQDNRC